MYEDLNTFTDMAASAFLLLAQAFEKLADEMIRSAENVKKVLKKAADCVCKRNPKTPKEYGISLLEKRKKLLLKRYSYIPIHRKHLPYQRRNY